MPQSHSRTSDYGRALLYSFLCALLVLIVAAGFGPGFIARLSSEASTPPILHFHAAVFVGWLALFTTQALLPAFGRTDLHRRLGRFGIWYAGFLVVVGLVTTVNRVLFYFNDGQQAMARAFFIEPLSDMILFPIFFAAAIAYRHRPGIHKRLMLVATVMLTIAAVARMEFLGAPAPYLVFVAVWLSPLLIAMLYDLYRYRIIHPAYVIGLVVLATVPMRSQLAQTDGWKTAAGWFISLFS